MLPLSNIQRESETTRKGLKTQAKSKVHGKRGIQKAIAYARLIFLLWDVSHARVLDDSYG